MLSGYLGDATLGQTVLDTVGEVRAVRKDMVYACDPVMGDEGRGFFVRPGIPEFFKAQAVPAADLVTPNQFELAWLADQPIASMEDAVAAAAKVAAAGPAIVVCTSLLVGPEDQLGILAHSAGSTWVVWTPKLPVNLNGTGDAFTALFLGHWLTMGRLDRSISVPVACARLSCGCGTMTAPSSRRCSARKSRSSARKPGQRTSATRCAGAKPLSTR